MLRHGGRAVQSDDRGARTTDIRIAATALRHNAVIVHNDTDFPTIHRAIPEFDQLRVRPEAGAAR